MAKLDNKTKARLLWTWRGWWARPAQIAPDGQWTNWLILAGRGFGKTRSGAEWIRERWKQGYHRMGIVAETSGDMRDVLIEGPSGILAISPKDERPEYQPNKRRIQWKNGAVAFLYSGTEPDQLRGPEHDTVWVDELAKYRDPDELWSNVQFGLRVGDDPRCCVTTTPRPIKVIRELIKDRHTMVTKGSTYDNFGNLPPAFIEAIQDRYEGTRTGRQELYAEVLDDYPGALWSRGMIKSTMMSSGMRRVVVAVDPSGTGGEEEEFSSEVGIIVAGLRGDVDRPQVTILEDGSTSESPGIWAKKVSQLYHKWQADVVVAERNFGGAMVESVIRTADPNINVKMVSASRGKVVRAEPVAALYEQGKIHHLFSRDDLGINQFEELEDQMTHMTLDGYVGEGSPDRVDAMVWAVTELMLNDEHSFGLFLKHKR